MSEDRSMVGTGKQFVSFLLSGEEYAIDIMRVQEIIRISSITRVPKMPDFVEGVINLRGKVIPVVDLRARFELEKQEDDKHSRIVVVELSGKITGLIVDSVSQVLNISNDEIEPAPSIGSKVSSEFILGVGKVGERLIILLEIDKILSGQEISELAEVDD
jgi:purine-binding chemotaxis protein CheW